MKKLILSVLSLGLLGVVQAQVTDTVSLGASHGNDVWYSLSAGEKGTADATNWDIAFQIGALTDAGVRINGGNGVEIYAYGNITDWNAVDTNGLNRKPLHNSNVSWSEGALKQIKDPGNPFDYGWGEYNPSTHNVDGTKMFIVKINATTYKKFKIEGLNNYSTIPSAFKNAYVFTYANLDGTNEVTDSVKEPDYPGKNYVYYSFASGKVIDREPVTVDKWDLLFTYYVDSVEHPFQPGVFFQMPLAGALSNPYVSTARKDVNNPSEVPNYNDWESLSYTTHLNTIGGRWKKHVPGVGYVLDSTRIHFLKDQDNKVWKIVFTGYSGSPDYNFIFTKEEIGSSAGVTEYGKVTPEALVYPNPATSKVSVILNNMTSSEVNISILNLKGQIVYQKEVTGNTDFEVNNISVSEWDAGIYIVHIRTNQNQITKKLIIQ